MLPSRESCDRGLRKGDSYTVLRPSRSGGDPFAQSRESLTAAVTTLLAAGATDGSLRGDVALADILASLSGVSLAAGAPEQRDQAAGCSTCSWMTCAAARGRLS